ncbi:MAG TPA: MFS transporter, partial [Thermoanaerobaculia bacterium]|nr:MFS transporter [Thermoanaerobaculia bacterium]
APVTYVALSNPNKSVYLPALAIGEVLIFMCTGPVNSAIVNAVSPLKRATAVGFSVFLMHLLGDIPSPPLIGALSDRSSLEQAFLTIPVAILISGAVWSYAAWRAR